MGKTSKPLTLVVDDFEFNYPEDYKYFSDLKDQGNTIYYFTVDYRPKDWMHIFEECDGIISDKAYGVIPEMNTNHKLYDMMIRGIRKYKYSPKKEPKT